MSKKILIVVIFLLVAAGALVSQRVIPASQTGKAPQLPVVKVAQVLTRDIDNTAVFIGKLQPVDIVELRPRVSGYVESARFSEGSRVHKGQVLFRIDRRTYQAEVDRLKASLEQARAQLKLAKANNERGQRLLRHHALSKEEADRLDTAATTAQAQVNSTDSALQIAKLNLGYTEVRSPIDGRVGRIMVTPGNLVTSSNVLTRIVSLSPIYGEFQVDERHYLNFERHRSQDGVLPTVDMGLADETAFPHHGRIDFIDNMLQSRTGTIRMRAVFSNNDGLFTPGLFVRIRLHSGERRPRILIDDRAIGTDLSNRFVYTVDRQGKVAYQRVVPGPLFAGLRMIKQGLTPDARIIVSGLQRVRPGMQVKIDTIAMQANLSPQDLNTLKLAASENPANETRLADAIADPAKH